MYTRKGSGTAMYVHTSMEGYTLPQKVDTPFRVYCVPTLHVPVRIILNKCTQGYSSSTPEYCTRT
jgi:hypothetical protein